MPLVIAERAPYSPADEAGFGAFDDQVGQAMGLLNAASAAQVAVVVRCIAERWWEMQEAHSPEHWCKIRLGVSPTTAVRLVRVARELPDYPLVSAAFVGGRLTFDQVDVIVTTAHPSYDRDLSEAGIWDVPRMRKIIRNFSRPKHEPPAPGPDPEPPGPGPEPEPVDHLRAGWGDDGRYRGSFDLGAELGALLDKTLGAARSALFTARTGISADDDDRTAEPSVITNLDALERLLKAALDGLDPAIAAGRRPGDRTQVFLHLDAEHPERSRIHLGPLLPVSVRQHLTCDADLRLAIERHGKTVALGRRQRTVGPLLRALIEDRDGGCVVEGCGRTGFLHVHHLWHWEDGGPTDPWNLCCLCPEHHRMVHAGRIRLVGNAETGLTTLDRWGQPLPRPGPLPPPHPLPRAASSFGPTHWGGRVQYN